jgi:hypothetical protein
LLEFKFNRAAGNFGERGFAWFQIWFFSAALRNIAETREKSLRAAAKLRNRIRQL